jgi:hypothetical protein
MLKQAQQMQKKMENVEDELRAIEVTGEAGGGAIIVKFNAKHEFISIKIKPEAINPESPESVDEDTLEMLEDLISSAIKEANDKAATTIQQKMNSISGGMGLNIPGIF